jgi:pfkB family carbohydrate kinase
MNQTVICLGAHVFDVQLRAVEAIPDGQGVALVEQIRLSPAGAAGGTSLTLAKLGAIVRSAGAIGADPIGDLFLTWRRRVVPRARWSSPPIRLLRYRPSPSTSSTPPAVVTRSRRDSFAA